MSVCRRWCIVGCVVLLSVGAGLGVACATALGPVKVTPLPGAPAVTERPGGCHVDIVEDGDRYPRRNVAIGRIELGWDQALIRERGPEGAFQVLRTAACEHGAFGIIDLRAMPRGAEGGLLYEGTLVTLVDDNGVIMNRVLDAGPAQTDAQRPEAEAHDSPGGRR